MGKEKRHHKYASREAGSVPEVNPLTLLEFTVLGTVHAGRISSAVGRAIAHADIIFIEGDNDSIWQKSIEEKILQTKMATGKRIEKFHPDAQIDMQGNSLTDHVDTYGKNLVEIAKQLLESENGPQDDQRFEELIHQAILAVAVKAEEQIRREDDIAKRSIELVRGAAKLIYRSRMGTRTSRDEDFEDQERKINVLLLFGYSHAEGIATALRERVSDDLGKGKDIGDFAQKIPILMKLDDTASVSLTDTLLKDIEDKLNRDIRTGAVSLVRTAKGEIIDILGETPRREMIRLFFYHYIWSYAKVNGLEESLVSQAMENTSFENMKRVLKTGNFETLFSQRRALGKHFHFGK